MAGRTQNKKNPTTPKKTSSRRAPTKPAPRQNMAARTLEGRGEVRRRNMPDSRIRIAFNPNRVRHEASDFWAHHNVYDQGRRQLSTDDSTAVRPGGVMTNHRSSGTPTPAPKRASTTKPKPKSTKKEKK